MEFCALLIWDITFSLIVQLSAYMGCLPANWLCCVTALERVCLEVTVLGWPGTVLFGYCWEFCFLAHRVGSVVCPVVLTISAHANSQGRLLLTGAVVSGYLPQKTDAENHHQADVLRSHKAAGHWGLVQWHQSSDHETAAQHCFCDRWPLFFMFCDTWVLFYLYFLR